MRTKRHTFLRVIAVLLAAVSFSTWASTGSVAPDFTLKGRDGRNIKLSELRGEVVMINFWASWCAPCRQEMPLLNDLYQRYRKLGFTLLGVNVEQNPRAAKRLLKDIPVDFPVLFDDRNEVSKAYDISAMPSTVLVDRDGHIRFVHRGYKPGLEERYQQQIRTLIRE